ncbi:MAG: 3-hydroxylacyl-ACP dehydratase [Proteobacteria bacterium]|nr:3-hydroxylacyl-ACP dehydratase [Pseudomonadota bacterium]
MRDVSQYPPVVDLLYHEPPMVLVDRFVAWLDEGRGVRCEVDIREDALFAAPQGIPAWVGIEYMAQAIGVYSGAHEFDQGQSPRIGFLLGSQNISLNCDYFAFGTVLDVEVRLSWDGQKLVQFDCAIRQRGNDEVLVQGCLNCYAPDRDEIEGLEAP